MQRVAVVWILVDFTTHRQLQFLLVHLRYSIIKFPTAFEYLSQVRRIGFIADEDLLDDLQFNFFFFYAPNDNK